MISRRYKKPPPNPTFELFNHVQQHRSRCADTQGYRRRLCRESQQPARGRSPGWRCYHNLISLGLHPLHVTMASPQLASRPPLLPPRPPTTATLPTLPTPKPRPPCRLRYGFLCRVAGTSPIGTRSSSLSHCAEKKAEVKKGELWKEGRGGGGGSTRKSSSACACRIEVYGKSYVASIRLGWSIAGAAQRGSRSNNISRANPPGLQSHRVTALR